ncbi:MAG: hypothetical protein NWE99_01925 [Candidatus Bathyarchaeota archaeon]|nr:hypothetical protein [Candidatus Bathyarchaeota archaeon]
MRRAYEKSRATFDPPSGKTHYVLEGHLISQSSENYKYFNEDEVKRATKKDAEKSIFLAARLQRINKQKAVSLCL